MSGRFERLSDAEWKFLRTFFSEKTEDVAEYLPAQYSESATDYRLLKGGKAG